MASKRTTYFNGSSGELWVLGEKIGTVSKGKVVKKQNYEEIPNPDVKGGVIRVPTNHTWEISFTFRPTGEQDKIDMFNLDEDVAVIMSNANIADTARRRVKCDGVTFDEQSLIDFEKHKVGEIELSGQAETVETLE